jgi:hypothetical protein
MIKLSHPLSFLFVALSLMPGCFIVADDSDDDGGGDSAGDHGDDCSANDDCKDGMVCTDGKCGGTGQPGDPCTKLEECNPDSVCFNEYCVGQGAMRISLAFTVDSDFDLHVMTPAGEEIFFGNSIIEGAELDVDQCISSCGSEAHAENVVFDSAPSGDYEVWVVNYDGRAAGSFNIEVAGAVNRNFSGSLTATSMEESERFTFTR